MTFLVELIIERNRHHSLVLHRTLSLILMANRCHGKSIWTQSMSMQQIIGQARSVADVLAGNADVLAGSADVLAGNAKQDKHGDDDTGDEEGGRIGRVAPESLYIICRLPICSDGTRRTVALNIGSGTTIIRGCLGYIKPICTDFLLLFRLPCRSRSCSA